MEDKLSKDQFELIRKILREKSTDSKEAPLKWKRRRITRSSSNACADNILDAEVNNFDDSKVQPPVVVIIDSDSSPEDNQPRDETINNNEDDDMYDSDEFEDVSDSGEMNNVRDISVTIDVHKGNDENSKLKKQAIRNMCSNIERKRRKEFHMEYLVCLLVSGYIRNEWLNNNKMHKRLLKLVPDQVFKLLHPERDEKMPLRSTRKLLDGLKKAMDLWNKHWRIMRSYEGLAFYMKSWDELKPKGKRTQLLTKNNLIRNILKGMGDHDIATQGFVALLRSCNLNARLVMSCQPPDFTNLKEEQKYKDYKLSEDNSKYPIFWCEVWDTFNKKWLTIDPVKFKTIEQVRFNSRLEPKGVLCSKRNIMRYVIAYDRKNGCRDVTRRYMHWYNSKGRRKRITKDSDGEQWYNKVISVLHKRKRTKIDDYEDDYFIQRDQDEGMPDNLQDLKNHPYYILEQSLRQNQILKFGSKECGYLKLQNKAKGVLKVFLKKDVITLKSGREWYMNGRVLKQGCRALKVIKKRHTQNMSPDDDDEERLYPIEDTELYIPPLAKADGEITKNTFGNIEVFVNTMIPQNCCLVESPISIKAARFLGIEFSPAVTKFKFEKGNKAKPILSGVVVAKWFREALECAIDGIGYTLAQDKIIEEEINALQNWNTLLLKVRIKNNLNLAYGKLSDPNQLEETDNVEEELEAPPTGGFLVPSESSKIEDYQFQNESNNLDEPPANGFLFSKESNMQKQERGDTNYKQSLSAVGSQTASAAESNDQEIENDDDDYTNFMDELDMSE